MDKDVENFLRFLRDLLATYSTLVETLIQTKKEYGYDHNVDHFDLSNQATLQDIFASLSPTKVGLLVSTMLELSSNQDKIRDVMKLNKNDLDLLDKILKTSVQNLSKVIGDAK